jgi:hypothetical protein
MHRGRIVRWISFAICCTALIAAPALLSAQAGTGSIWGTVGDAHGAPLGGVKVTLLNVETKVSTGASTDGTGEYRFEGLKPGNYEVNFDTPGLVPKTQSVKVKAGKKTNVSERLKPPPPPDTDSK